MRDRGPSEEVVDAGRWGGQVFWGAFGSARTDRPLAPPHLDPSVNMPMGCSGPLSGQIRFWPVQSTCQGRGPMKRPLPCSGNCSGDAPVQGICLPTPMAAVVSTCFSRVDSGRPARPSHPGHITTPGAVTPGVCSPLTTD